MKKKIVVDIGSSSIKLLQVSFDRNGYNIEKASIIKNPEPEFRKKNDSLTMENLANAIKETLYKEKFSGREAVSSLCGSSLHIHYFDFPSLSSEELKSALYLEAGQVFPGGSEEMTSGYLLLPSKKGKKNVLFVAVAKEKVDKIYHLFLQSKLRLSLLNVDSLALINSFTELEKERNEEIVLVLNIGANFTNLALFQKNGFLFIRDVPVGGNTITRLIKEERGVKLEEAEKMKRNLNDYPDLDIESIIKKGTIKLVEEINRSLNYFYSSVENKRVEKAFLTGGSSRLPFLSQFLSEELALPVEKWNPLNKVKEGSVALGNKGLGDQLAIALGLALEKN